MRLGLNIYFMLNENNRKSRPLSRVVEFSLHLFEKHVGGLF